MVFTTLLSSTKLRSSGRDVTATAAQQPSLRRQPSSISRSRSRGRSQTVDGGTRVMRESSTAASGSNADRDARNSDNSENGSSENSGAGTISDDNTKTAEYISDEMHLATVEIEAPDLRELNSSLAALEAVFPNVQVEVFREMLTNFDGESRLALVADALLKNRVTWVKGRWRVANKDDEGRGRSRSRDDSRSGSTVPAAERFRTTEYQKAATTLACHEFMGLSRSTINAVMAEHNYAYLECREALVRISGKSWRFALSSLFLRRKPVTSAEAENHPLIVWKSSGRGSIVPTVRATGSAELDRELFEVLIVPLRAARLAAQEAADRELAKTVNLAEAEAADATYECTCCFGTVTFEELTTCGGDAAHAVCFRCVQQVVREAVFGQGWARTIDPDKGTLRCPAVDSTECTGLVPYDQVHRALMGEARGGDVERHLERRLAEHNLLGSGLLLVRCPFCEYAEVDDVYVPFHEPPLHVRVDSLYSLLCLLLLFGATPVLLLAVVAVSVLVAVLPSVWVRGIGRRNTWLAALNRSYLGAELAAAMTRYRRRRRGQQFRCQNPRCGRVSCLGCGKAWVDIHVCHESSLVALRTQVEQAMSMAIKRVCPRCHTSFVKTAGCNKLTCPCGYKMCYVCRRDISGNDGPDAGYRHFCDHFRPHGDGRACGQCRKCNLWESEDTEAVLAAARAEAERKWKEMEQRELSLAERAFLETGIAAKPTAASAATRRLVGTVLGDNGGSSRNKRLPSVPELLDWLLESVLI